MSYAKALAALEAYEPKALAALDYEWHGACCAIGAILPAFRPESGSVAVLCRSDKALAGAVEAMGMTVEEARRLQQVNDKCYLDDSERYFGVQRWLRERVAKEAVVSG